MGIGMEILTLAKPASSAHPPQPPLPISADDSIKGEDWPPRSFLFFHPSDEERKKKKIKTAHYPTTRTGSRIEEILQGD